MNIRTIVVTTDLSDTSRLACPAARAFARAYDARVVVAHVREPAPFSTEYAAVDVSGLDKLHGAWTQKALEEFVATEFGDLSDVQVESSVGTAHEDIVRLATACRADLIVMATHGRGFFSHAFLGSTTERVVRRAPCPVLVVRERRNRS